MILPDRKLVTTDDGSHTILADDIGEHYHSTFGAVQESRHVYIVNGFEVIERSPVKLLEVGFGTGLNALLTLVNCSSRRLRTYYTGIDNYRLDKELIERLNYPDIINQGDRFYFNRIHQARWNGEEEINKYFVIMKKEADLLKTELTGEYDIIYYDAFAPDFQPELWSENIILSVAGLLSKGGIFVTYSASGALRRHLRKAGLLVENPPGPPGKRQITRALKE